MSHRFIAALLLIAAALVASVAIANTTKPSTTTAATLPRDPNNLYGEFDNGLKFIVRKNANPPGKVSIYLHIKTGALNETEQQNGLAHFIEHMAFNGSTHFKPGELIPLLNRMGMTFGADTNAHTNLQETVYKLSLPDTKPATLDTAMTIFADYASGVSFGKDEIESERGVILEELLSRKGVGERLRKKVNEQLFAGSRLAVHDVIGDAKLIKTFPREQFVDYWDAWYRPENMTLIAVGDINPDEIIAKAKEKLGGMKPRTTAREAKKAELKPFTEPRVLIFTDPEQVAGEVEMIALNPGRLPITTLSQYRTEVIENVGHWIVNRRFSDIIQRGSAPFRDASVNTGDYLHEAFAVFASSEGEPADWNKMLDALVAEVSRAIDHGFTTGELELAKRSMLARAERAVETEPTRDSRAIVNELSGAVGNDLPILSAAQELELMKGILADVTTDELHKAFVANFKTKNYTYALTMPESKDVKLPDRDEVMAAANAAWAKKTTPPEESNVAGSILPSEPDAGTVASRETDEQLGLTNVTFANGVVMHHKFSDYKKDQVLISLNLPGGAIEETADNKGVSEAASLILARPATSRFTSSQIRDLMTGRKVSVGGGIGMDTMSLSVSGSPKELPLGMQLAYAILTDGKLEQSALDDWKKRELQALERRKTAAQAHLRDAMTKTVYGGDLRMAELTEPIINRQERSPAEQWFKRIANHAAIEVTVVGDLPLEPSIELVAKYVGSLPKRTGDFAELNKLRRVGRGPGPYAEAVHFSSVTPKAVVLAGFLGCDALDPERRPLTLAGIVLTDRMIKRIREKEQLVYSIGCQSQPAVALPGTGLFAASAPTDPQNTEKLAGTVIEMIKDFAAKGPTEDELTTAKKQIATMLVSQMKEPSFWLSQINDLAYRGRPLSDLKQLPDIYQTFTAEQVRDAVRKYATDDRMVSIQVIPDETSKPATAPIAAPAPAAVP